MPQAPTNLGGHRWLALGEDALPPGEQWLAPGEAAVLAGLRYTKRRTEYLLRRLVTKHAVASIMGTATDPGLLARIEVRNASSGAPYVVIDGDPLALGVSISDRAGWAVCVTSPTADAAVGCDLELVEPRARPLAEMCRGRLHRNVIRTAAPQARVGAVMVNTGRRSAH